MLSNRLFRLLRLARTSLIHIVLLFISTLVLGFKICTDLISKFCIHIYESIFNGRSFAAFILDFSINCSLVILWAVLIKLVNITPIEWRPPIFHRLCMRLDEYLFNSFIGSSLSIACLILVSWMLYSSYYDDILETPPLKNHYIYPVCYKLDTSPIKTSSETSENNSSLSSPIFSSSRPSATYSQDMPYTNSGVDLENDLELSLSDDYAHRNLDNYLFKFNTSWWKLGPPILLASAWFLITFINQFNSTFVIEKPKFILAWVAYVILHFVSPLLVCVWLYVSKPPGSLKLFLLACGLQNTIIILTYFFFPNTPPLFFKLYGEHLKPTFDLIYHDGISRKDMKVGRIIHQSIYYAAPTKFASLPSQHSAMACMNFLFVSYYGNWPIIKLVALSHILLQWWSSLYLEHHWRVDLLAGLMYAIGVFTVIKLHKFGLDANHQNFTNARSRFDFQKSSTFGMRLFRSTKLERLFDPISDDFYDI